jgi:hypothetical protein
MTLSVSGNGNEATISPNAWLTQSPNHLCCVVLRLVCSLERINKANIVPVGCPFQIIHWHRCCFCFLLACMCVCVFVTIQWYHMTYITEKWNGQINPNNQFPYAIQIKDSANKSNGLFAVWMKDEWLNFDLLVNNCFMAQYDICRFGVDWWWLSFHFCLLSICGWSN